MLLSLGTFSTRFTELVGVPPSTYRREGGAAAAGMPPCVVKQVDETGQGHIDRNGDATAGPSDN